MFETRASAQQFAAKRVAPTQRPQRSPHRYIAVLATRRPSRVVFASDLHVSAHPRASWAREVSS